MTTIKHCTYIVLCLYSGEYNLTFAPPPSGGEGRNQLREENSKFIRNGRGKKGKKRLKGKKKWRKRREKGKREKKRRKRKKIKEKGRKRN